MMARALRVYPPATVQQAPPNGPSPVDRMRKILTDAGADAITCTVPVVVARGVLEALELAEMGKRSAEHDARAARATTKHAGEEATRERERANQAEARHRTAMKQAAKEKA